MLLRFEEEESLRALIREYKIENKIFIHKDLDNDALLPFYRRSHLFVLPSLHEAEAFGVVQLEAMANSMPVINTRLQSGVPFVSLNNETGFTVSPGSVEELRNAIEKIVCDKDLYQQFSISSFERSKEFTREKMARSYWEVYNA